MCLPFHDSVRRSHAIINRANTNDSHDEKEYRLSPGKQNPTTSLLCAWLCEGRHFCSQLQHHADLIKLSKEVFHTNKIPRTTNLLRDRMYKEQSYRNIQYHIVESPQLETTTTTSPTHNNESIIFAFHSSLICFKIALCILL